MRRRSSVRVLLAAGLAAGAGSLVAACGGDDGGNDSQGPNPVVEGAREIPVTGENLRFDPDEIDVQANEDFTIVLTSGDTFHDFTIEDVDGVIDATSGETNKGGYKIDEAGEYTFYCSVPGHRDGGMEGTLTVE